MPLALHYRHRNESGIDLIIWLLARKQICVFPKINFCSRKDSVHQINLLMYKCFKIPTTCWPWCHFTMTSYVCLILPLTPTPCQPLRYLAGMWQWRCRWCGCHWFGPPWQLRFPEGEGLGEFQVCMNGIKSVFTVKCHCNSCSPHTC